MNRQPAQKKRAHLYLYHRYMYIPNLMVRCAAEKGWHPKATISRTRTESTILICSVRAHVWSCSALITQRDTHTQFNRQLLNWNGTGHYWNAMSGSPTESTRCTVSATTIKSFGGAVSPIVNRHCWRGWGQWTTEDTLAIPLHIGPAWSGVSAAVLMASMNASEKAWPSWIIEMRNWPPLLSNWLPW